MTKWLVAKVAPLSAGGRNIDLIEYTIPERPLLHACCANDTFGDVRVDIRPEVHPDKVCAISQRIPYPDNSFGAAYADFPWTASFKRKVANSMKELLRVAPIVYTISPWTYGSSRVNPPEIMVRWSPGVNHVLLFARYTRKEITQ